MTSPAELRVWREYLGLTHEVLAAEFGVDERTIRRWEAGTWAMPVEHQAQLHSLIDDTEDETDAMVTDLEQVIAAGERPVIVVWRTADGCAGANPGGPPRYRTPGYQRAIAGRILANLPPTSIDVVYGEDLN